MIFSCERNILSEALNTVIKAASSKSSLPILEGVLINTDEDFIILTTNNLELGIECRIPAIVKEDGSIVVGDAKVFSEIIRKLPGGLIDIEVQDNHLIAIKNQKSVYNLMGINPVEFPELVRVSGEINFSEKSDKIKNMIRQSSFAIAQKHEKPILTGSLFEIENSILSVVSTDYFRLAIRREKITDDIDDAQFIIPGKTLNELNRILKDDDTLITVKVGDKYASFEFDNTKVVTRLIDGEFFNYKATIPADFKIKTKIKLNDILTCVERADPIVAVDVFKNPIIMTLENDTISIDCMTSTGKAHDVIEIEKASGEIKIGFNQKYLHDALAACECEYIILEFNGNLNPCIIRPYEGDSFLYMVLPVRINA